MRTSSGWARRRCCPASVTNSRSVSRYVKGLVDSIQHRIDVNDLTTREAEALDLNGLARVRIALEEPVAIDDYKLSSRHRLVHHRRPAALRHRRRRHGHRAARAGRARELGRGLAADQGHRADPRQPEEPEARRGVVHRACRARASPRWPMRWNRRWCSAATTPICSTATTCATASTRTWISPRPGAPKTSAASAKCRRCSSTPGLIVITAFISPFRADRNKHPRAHRRRAVHRDLPVDFAGRVREARSEGPVREGARRRDPRVHRHRFALRAADHSAAHASTLRRWRSARRVDQILRYLENKGFLHQADPGL